MAGKPVMNGSVQGLPVVHLELVKPGPTMKFVFKMFKEDGQNTPLLIPQIDNPSKVPVPGIVQLIKGDLGITEKIFAPILKPILPFFANPQIPIEKGKNQAGSYDYGTLKNLNSSQKDYVDSVLGNSVGFKSLEKASVQGMMESLKPLMEIALILMELLAVIEDVICRFLATAIKIPIKGWIGFPSRKPKYTFGSLNHNIKHFRKALADGIKAFSSGNTYSAIASTIPSGSATPPDANEDPDSRDSVYLAYFDEDGNRVEPPTWVKNSGKWGFANDQPVLNTTTGDDPEKFGFPFLSDATGVGINQLYKYHLYLLNKNPEIIQKSEEIASKIESTLPPRFVNEEKILGLLGPDFDPTKHIDEISGQVDSFKNEITNSVRETLLNEYINKHLNSQLKNRYIEKESTGQIFENKNIDENVDPEDRNSIRIVFPTYSDSVVLTGDSSPSSFTAEIYTVPKGRIAKELTQYKDDFRQRNDDGSYVELRQDRDWRIYYEKINLVPNFQDTDTLDAFFNTSDVPVNVPKDKVIVPENTKKLRNNKIPGKVLAYYLPLEWEEILEYEVRKTILRKDESGNVFKETNVVGIDTEVIQNRIEPESQYEIRVIQVINLPILPDGSVENLNAAFPKPNYLAVFRDTQTETSKPGFFEQITNPAAPSKYLQIAELYNSDPLNVFVNITVAAGTGGQADPQTITSFKLYDLKDNTKLIRYVNSDQISVGGYFYIRYLNTKFGQESSNKNKDNGEFYKIKSFREKWNTVNITSTVNTRMNIQSGTFPSQPTLIEDKDDDRELIIFDGDKQTLKIHKSKNTIPSYITDSPIGQVRIVNGSVNKGKFFVSKIQQAGDYFIYTFDPGKSDKRILSERIVAIQKFSQSGSNFTLSWTPATLTLDYLDSTEIEFEGKLSSYKGALELYPVKELSVIDKMFNQKGNLLYLDGINREQNYRDQSDQAEAVKKASSYLEDIDKMIDGFYKVNGVKTIATPKGLSIKVIDLDPNNFANIPNRTAFISNPKVSWYRPFRISEAPTLSDIEGNKDLANFNKETGTTFYNEKFVAPPFRIPQKYKGNNFEHIAPVINKGNGRGESIVFHGVDPRYLDRTKWKVFWLVEGIKKDIAPIIFGEQPPNEPVNIDSDEPSWKLPYPDPVPDGDPSGKEWYHLVHKLTVTPYLISKLAMIAFGKLIPAIKKLIKLVSNPAKITDLLLEIARMKLAQNMEFFDDTYTRTLQSDLQEALNSDAGTSKYFYTGKVTNPNMPQTASYILDGVGVVKFGACLGLNFPFGVKVNALNQSPKQTKPTFNSGWFESVVKDERTPAEKDKTIYQTKRDQPIIKMILNFLKVPFEVLFMIVKWLMCWIKKLTSPPKLIPAVIELLSFKWLLCIIHPMTLVKIIGASGKSCGCGCNSDDGSLSPDMLALLGDFDNKGDQIGDMPQNPQGILDDLIRDLAGLGDSDLIEVLVYNIYRNGIFIRSEEVTIPYTEFGDEGIPGNLTDGNGINNSKVNNASAGKTSPLADSVGTDNAANTGAGGCGERVFDLSALINLPFVADMPKMNKCELIQLFLKPLEMILGILKTIQEFLNGFISMPVAILGLEPTMKVPRVEIISKIEQKLEKLKQKLSQTKPRSLVP